MEPLPSYQQFLIVGFGGYESCTRCLATARLEHTYFLRYFGSLGRMTHFSLLILFLILIQSGKKGKWSYTIHGKIVMPEHTYTHTYIHFYIERLIFCIFRWFWKFGFIKKIQGAVGRRPRTGATLHFSPLHLYIQHIMFIFLVDFGANFDTGKVYSMEVNKLFLGWYNEIKQHLAEQIMRYVNAIRREKTGLAFSAGECCVETGWENAVKLREKG
jgi:hypothetical protein